MKKDHQHQIFQLQPDFKTPLENKFFNIVKGPVEQLLAFPQMNRVYDDVMKMKDERPFPDKVLHRLNVTYTLSDTDLARINIPSGPMIVVVNHPFGGIECIILASLLYSIRSDVKFMANSMLNCIPEIRDMLICVNPFQGKNSVRENVKPILESMKFVKDGGMLVVFPAGAVSHFDPSKGVVTDPAWSSHIARMVRKTGAPVLPIFFQGTNSLAFHLAGMIHPLLRTAMIPGELLNKKNRDILVCIGSVLTTEKLQHYNQDDELIKFLRMRTYVMESTGNKGIEPGFSALIKKVKQDQYKKIVETQNPQTLESEIHALPGHHILAEAGEFSAIYFTGNQLPLILREIGRLRELSFRSVGEGTGKSVDLDRFDDYYTHLFIWNRDKKEIVGAYRLGKTDEILENFGIAELYTATLFRYKPEFFNKIGIALEMGRSFIRPEYQKSFAPFLLLWKGIGNFIVQNPQYKTLFGPVSISDEYGALSRQFIFRYLQMTKYRTDIAQFVKAKKPFVAHTIKGWDIDAAVRLIKHDENNISEMIDSIEKHAKGIPVLLDQYLRMGGEIAGFNVDSAFGNVLDGLIVVDLTKTQRRVLERYMGKSGAEQFLNHHAVGEINSTLSSPMLEKHH